MPSIKKGGNKRLYNIHNITLDIEDKSTPLNRNTVKNLEIICLRCGHTFVITLIAGFKGIRCIRCNAYVRADINLLNYRANPILIIDNKSLPTYQIGWFRIKVKPFKRYGY